MDKSVNIYVLNWNGKDLTIDCLNSLKKITYPNAHIVVIDNGSTDGSIDAISNQFHDCEIIELAENFGFSKGNNAGFKSVKRKSDYTIFLNNDTIVSPNFVEPLIIEMEVNSNIKQSVPKIYYADQRDLIWFAGGKVSLWNGYIRHIGIRKKDSSIFSKLLEIDYATGCCICMRSEDFSDIGMFDESFLMYGEDVDLSLRFKKEGGGIIFVPDSKIWHKVSASLGGQFSLKKWKRKFFAKIKLLSKNFNQFQLFIFLPLVILMSISELLFYPIIIILKQYRSYLVADD